MQGLDFITSIVILILSVVAHEVAHGAVANSLGDPTARLQGRLTLNPIKHIDPVGSIFVPAIAYLVHGPIFGWAKPVPYNPYNLQSAYGPALVAAAGPATNLIIAVFFALVIRISHVVALPDAVLMLAAQISFINLFLAIFNLIPVPPLDGSKVLFSSLPYRYAYIQAFLEQWGILGIFLVVFIFWQFIEPFVIVVFRFMTGLPV